MAIRFHAAPGAGVTASVEPPPNEPLHRWTTTRPRCFARGAAVSSTPTSWPTPSPAAARWSSSTSTTPGRGWCPWSALRPEQGGDHLRTGHDPTPLHPRASPGSCCAAIRPGDSARSPSRVPPNHRRARPGRSRGVRWSGTRSRPGPASRWTRARRTWTGWRSASAHRRIHQAGGIVNVVVAGINVGAQPYWNAEATMLMHTRASW